MSENDWGFTTLERDIFTKQVFEDKSLLQLYIYLRSQAKYVPTKKLINNKWRELQPGELTVGSKQLAAVLDVSTPTAFRMLKKLQKLGEITTENLISCTLVRLTYWPQREIEMKSKNEKSEKGSSHTAASDTADFWDEDEIEMKSKWNPNEIEMKTPITGYKDNRKTKGLKDQSPPTNQQIIAELVNDYRQAPGAKELSGDYAFIGSLYNQYGYEKLTIGLEKLKQAMAIQDLQKPLLYLRGILQDKPKPQPAAKPPKGVSDFERDKEARKQHIRELYQS